MLDGVAVSIGSDGNQGASPIEVAPTQVDFLSIDGTSDTDVFQFTLDSTFDMTFTLDMVGPAYTRNGGAYDLSSLSDLDLVILDSDGVSILAESNTTGLNVTESINLLLGPGTYYSQITGRDDAVQFYEYTFVGLQAVPEPGSLLVLGLFGTVVACRRRRKAV